VEDDTRASDDTRGVAPAAKVDALPALAHGVDFAAFARTAGGAMLSVAKAVNMFYRRAAALGCEFDRRRASTYDGGLCFLQGLSLCHVTHMGKQ
jgi:hypothetical protein